jgi:sugar phosphate isomerase/epimerase
MVPAAMKITGPDADPAALEAYLRTILRRARALGVEKLVFGSGAARTIPDGFDREMGERQLTEFVRTAGCMAADQGVTIVLEHLNRGEGNVLTTLSDCVGMARAIGHPNVKVLVDTFHLWAEGEPVDHVRGAMPLLAHVHLADLAGRVAPGEGSPPSDYRPLFRLLKAGAYSGTMSVEAVGFEPAMYGRVLEFIKAQWDQA